MSRTSRIVLWLVVSVWLLFAVSWGVLHGWIVPRIGEFRPRLEMEASKALGVPVRIGEITAASSGLIPSFQLSNVVLLDAQGNEALRLPRLQASLSPSSLWGLGFEQIFIDQPELAIRRAADGKVFVGGLDVTQNRGTGHEAADWFFSQTEFVIRGGTVRWTDELRAAPPVVLTQVDWVMSNGRRRHAMRLDATPPPEWGERFSLRGIFRQPLLSRNAGEWMEWSGQLYGEFNLVDLSRIRQYAGLDTIGIQVGGGRGGVRAWADVHLGKVTGGTADVALFDVDAQLGRELKPLALESIAGRFGGRQFDNGFEFNTEGLRFNTRDGLQWPGGNVAFTHTGAEGDAAQRGELKADRLDLAALALIANRLPLGTATHALIASYAPKGLVDSVEARWQGDLAAPVAYAAKGRVSGLEMAALPSSVPAGTASHPHPGRPGISGGTIDFDMTQAGGKATVRIASGAVEFPGVFEEPRVPISQLSTEAQWKLQQGRLEVDLRNLKFANGDADGQAQANWRSGEAPGQSLGVLDLTGSLSRGNGARVHRYLPMVLPERVRHYVRDAVVQGGLTDVKFRVKGEVDHIPFSKPGQGEFSITAKVSDGLFAYVPKSVQPVDAVAWPALTDVHGELVFNHAALDINNARARVASQPGLQLVKADAHIADLMHSVLEVNASLKGPLGEALAFVNTSPLAAMTSHALAKATGTGTADYGMRLNLPLSAMDKTQVQGTVSLPGNDVQFMPGTPLLARLKGMATFSESGFHVAAAQARMLGGDVRFDGGLRAGVRSPGSTELETIGSFKAQGTLTAEGLRQAKDLGMVSRMAQSATGGTAYSAAVGLRRGVAEISVSSNLQGLGLNLPAPLSKSAETALPVRFENALLRESLAPGQKLQDQLSLTAGRVASVVYVRDVSTPEPRVLRGSIGVGLEPGETTPMPENGVAANINLASVDLDAWEKILSDSTGSGLMAGGVATPVAPPVPGSRPAAPSAGSTYLPTQMAIRAKLLTVEGRKLNNVVVGGSREGLNWRANIDATELNGYLEFRQPGGAGAGRVYARLSRLSLAQSSASEVEAILDEQPASIPALDIVVDDLELRGKKLGRVEIEAVNRGALAAVRDGGVREWRLNKFNVILPEAVLTASGNWVAVNAQSPPAAGVAPRAPRNLAERRRTVMNFKLEINDSGELLKRFGMNDVVRRGKGRMEGQVSWLGSPLSLDYPSLGGQFNVNVEGGQFLKADPGIAKLLGVLSLQSLPRRLTLDFRDVFSQGFAFDFVRGDVTITQGLAYTNNLQMKGVNAAVLMEGNADIAKETQDLKVIVIPEINAGTASLIATVINPAIGLGTFLAQVFLRRPLIQAATQEFHIDGSWADPKITKVDRKP